MTERSFKKAVTVWRHVVRTKHDWAVVLLDSTGVFSAVSSYGAFGYLWSAHGHQDFRQFFLGRDFERHPDYFAGKFRSRQVFDEEASFQAIRTRILQGRREGSLTKDFARKEWEHFTEVVARGLSHPSSISEWDFRTWYEGTSFSDAGETSVYKDDPEATAFVQHMLPLLAEELRWDLEAEACGRGEVAHG